MKTQTRNAVLSHVLTLLALKLMAASPDRDSLQKRCEGKWNHLRATLADDELKPVEHTARIFTLLGEKLLRCDDIAQLELSVAYVESLLNGEVLIAEEDQLTPNR